MKKLLLCSFTWLLFMNGFGQYPENAMAKERVKKDMWSDSDPDFRITKCDDKWKNESAVILCKKYEYSVQKEILIGTAYEKIYTHTRLLLIDKAAVNEFSTFKFDISRDLGTYFGWGNNVSIFVGVKVIKPDGTEKEVPIDESLIDAVTYHRQQKQTQKVAVPGLEAGDILDYYYASEKAIPVQGFYPFSPVIYPLVEDYPIMKHKIEMHIMRKCYLNARSMNNAPELIPQDDNKRRDMVYTITDIDRDKVKLNDQILFYPLRELPVLIFQAYYVNTPIVKNNYCFYDKLDVIKKDVSEYELREFLNNHMNFQGDKVVRKTLKYIKKLRKQEKDPKVLAREAYYFYRQFVYAQNFKLDMARNSYKYSPPDDYGFVRSLSAIFRYLDISHSVVVTVPRELGNMNDLIMPNQMGFLISLNVDTPVYISKFNRYSLFNETDDSYQGTDAEALRINSYVTNWSISSAKVPVAKYTENNLTALMDVSFDPEEADKLLVSRKVTATGLNKRQYQRTVILPEDYVRFNDGERHGVMLNPGSERGTEQRKFIQFNDREVQNRDETMNKLIKEDLDIADIKETKTKVLQPGIWDDSPALIFTDSIEISKFITKAGNNIILEAGKLIGRQLTPQASDSVRKFNIYVPWARGYSNEISVKIPQGYVVKGAEQFAFTITNETGGFISSAKVEGDRLLIKTSKYFAENYFSKEKWPQIIKILNVANDFRNQKVMFVGKE
ncbi:MAG TPA: hypothetical protein VIH57_13870 [Bacteroidales bacterium]